MSGRTNITRFLPDNEYQAAISSNSPSATNPFATIADLSGISQDLQSVMNVGSSATVSTIPSIIYNDGVGQIDTFRLGGRAQLKTQDATGYVDILLRPASSYIRDTANSQGIKYSADYSVNGIANYGDLWIPSYGAVKNQIGGKNVNALIKAPTVTQDGYAVTWDNTIGNYTLTSIGADGNGIYTGSGSLSVPTTVTMGSNSLTLSGNTTTLIGGASSGSTVSFNARNLDNSHNMSYYNNGNLINTGGIYGKNLGANNTLTGGGYSLRAKGLLSGSSGIAELVGNKGFSKIDIRTSVDDIYMSFIDSTSTSTILISSLGNTYFNGGNTGFGTITPTAKVNIAGGNLKVEGLTDTNLLLVDYSVDKVGIGVAAGSITSKLTVNGDLETLGNGNGVIVADAVTGTRYRIFMNNGVLTTQLA